MRRVLFLGFLLAFAAAPALAESRADARAAYDRAAKALKAGQVRAAWVESRNAVQADPAWGQAHALQGEIALALGDGVGAEAELVRARETGMPVAELRHLLAHAHILNGRVDLALAEASAADVPPRFAAYAARMQGRALAAMEDMDAARAAFDRALALAPGDTAVWSDLGHFRMLAADQAGAVEAADRAVALAPGNLEALILKGELARNQYGLVAALPWFARALEADPMHVPALIEAAATLGDLGRMQEMLAMTRRILAIDGRNAQAFYLQSVLAARAGDYDLARMLIQRTGDRLDDVPGAMVLRAALEIRSGNLEQAISRLSRLADAQPDNIRARRMLAAAMARVGDHHGIATMLQPLADRPDADAYVLSITGRAFEALGDRETAARYLDRAARPVLGEPMPFGTGADLAALAREAQIDPSARTRIAFISGLIWAGEKDRALIEARGLAAASPGTPAAHMLVGDALVALGRFAEAAEPYRLAANISFSEPVALRLIDAAQRAGQPQAALATLRLFLAQNPQNPTGLMLAANYFSKARDWDRAIRILENLRTRLGDRDAVMLNSLAWAYLEKGDATRGLKLAATAYRLLPGNPAVTGTYGWLVFKAGGSRARAIALLEKARDMAPDDPATLRRLAEVRAAGGLA